MSQFQSLSEVFAALRRRAFLIVLVFVLGCAASVFIASQQGKLFEATAVVQIEDARVTEDMTDSMTAQATGREASRRVRLIEQRLMARDNLIEILDTFDLFPDAVSFSERVFMLRSAITLDELRGNAQPWQTDVVPSGLSITVRLDDPEDAAAVANELMGSVIAQARSRSATRTAETLSFFDAEAARVATEISEAENEIADFKRENSDALPEGLEALRTQLAALRDQLLTLDREILALENNAARLRAASQERQVDLLNEQKGLIEARIDRIEADIARAPEIERTLAGLERELDQLQERYSVVGRRRADAEMAQVLLEREASDRYEVLETALPPETSISRSKRKVAAAGGVASLFLALGLALLLEIARPVIRTPAQMEHQLGIVPVVSIPTVRSRRDHSRRRWLWTGGLLALVFAVIAALRAVSAGLGDAGLIERLLPGRTEF
ncbi:Putative tyrosine-protein kinase in cps region [Roseivivax jejudonensis]|uniref:Putative tyrosine-protein kinase in cps region n=1 Tax=Roseivivax jejudonensis TaxID=1529041 RepID=A0A1X6YKT5_9RHOB|nr:chain-length determining protein [Roseivivax jejudonensis]SLN22461.1 Putative tyrosine-protein kinase in cps region [Roseivivax jejudonensis]